MSKEITKHTPYDVEDRSFPKANEDGTHEYIGTLDPNFYCRQWNGKRNKYCKQRAGHNTDHPGIGRCAWHLGRTPVKHGRYSKIKRTELAGMIAELEEDPDPLDMYPELATARAIFIDWINRYDEIQEALLAWHNGDDEEENPKPTYLLDISDGYRLLDLIRKTVTSIEKIASENAISRPELMRVMTEMGRVVESNVSDEESLERIKHGWGTIRIA